MDHGIESFEELAEIVKRDRLRPVLVRCSCCRFTAAAQDVKRIIDALTVAGDHVRDMYCTSTHADMIERCTR